MEIDCDSTVVPMDVAEQKRSGDENEDLQSILDSSNVKALFSGWKQQ